MIHRPFNHGDTDLAGYLFSLTALLCLAAVSVCVCGCTGDGGSENPDAVSGAGTIVYNDLEGGFYGIVADDGTRYFPLNMPDEFKEDGRSVSFAGILRPDVSTIQQWGTPLELTDLVSGNIAVSVPPATI